MAGDNQVGAIARLLLSGGLSAIAIKIANAGLTYLMFIVLARAMPGGEFGHFAFGFTLAIALSSLLTFGLPVTALRLWPQYQAGGREAVGRSFVARSGVAVLAGSALCCALAAGVAWLLWPAEIARQPYLPAVALLAALLSVSEMVASCIRATGRMISALAPRDVVWRVLVIAAAGLVLASGATLDAAVAIAGSAALLGVLLVPQTVAAVRWLALRWQDLRGATERRVWLSSAVPNWGSSVLFALIQQFDVIIVGLFMAPEMTGPYFAAIRTAGLQNLMIIASNLVAAPLISRYYHGGETAQLRRMCRLLIVGIAVPTLICFAIMVAFGRELLALFDPAFADAYPVLVILASGFTVSALAGPAASFMQMVGKEREYLTIMAVTYTGVIASQFLLVPVYGALGAAIPNAIGAAVWSVWAVARLRAGVGIDPSLAGLIAQPGVARLKAGLAQ